MEGSGTCRGWLTLPWLVISPPIHARSELPGYFYHPEVRGGRWIPCAHSENRSRLARWAGLDPEVSIQTSHACQEDRPLYPACLHLTSIASAVAGHVCPTRLQQLLPRSIEGRGERPDGIGLLASLESSFPLGALTTSGFSEQGNVAGRGTLVRKSQPSRARTCRSTPQEPRTSVIVIKVGSWLVPRMRTSGGWRPASPHCGDFLENTAFLTSAGSGPTAT